jgi:anti-sigma factor RsiW
MGVTRDVVLDLLPLYLAGEASPDTQALVKDHLEHDPDLARLARQWQERMAAPPPAPLHPDAQALAYREANRKIVIKTIGLAAAFAAVIIALIAGVGLLAFFVGAP